MNEEKEHAWHDWNLKLPRLAVLLIAALCWPATVLAQDKLIPLHIYEQEGLSIYLLAAPCVDQIRENIRPEKRPLYQALDSTWPMKDGSRQGYAGCWREMSAEETGSEAAFAVIFSDGENFIVPKSVFNKRHGQVGT